MQNIKELRHISKKNRDDSIENEPILEQMPDKREYISGQHTYEKEFKPLQSPGTN